MRMLFFQLCFQSLRALAHNGTHIDSSDPWLYFMVCTNGHVSERGIHNMSVFRVAVDWYVKVSSGSCSRYCCIMEWSVFTTVFTIQCFQEPNGSLIQDEFIIQCFQEPNGSLMPDEFTIQCFREPLIHQNFDAGSFSYLYFQTIYRKHFRAKQSVQITAIQLFHVWINIQE